LAGVREKFKLGEEDGVSISQIACTHPECGEAETVILLMRAGQKTQALKILKPLNQVVLADLDAIIGETPLS
jgi:hypothetical protein